MSEPQPAAYTPKLVRLSPNPSGRQPQLVHAVRDDTGRALCRERPTRGWNDTAATAITCPRCLAKLAEEAAP